MKDIKNYTDKELKEKIIQDLESEFRILYKKLLKEKDYLARDNILELMTIYNMGINSYSIAKRFEMNEDKSLIQVPLFERYIIGRKFAVKYNDEKQRYELKSTFCEF
ncbi:hypothetical protein K1X34_04765 [Campylobacter jejuni]|uniref:hypothetical protein n=1 Tax=Campylobacter jejuni TaxID=197 RepID=UPI000257EEF2|nr:hypothetical protein [Campylobacter jejuni]EAJ2984991.1 hypothetical protein [Campylobacter jejuni]EDK9208881.1 hypothetical protein [Campylobacter jejuni]EIB29653.1 hypothetical protein cje110_05361 [Campylobacter jejuni subsp. jejuni LMG 23264]EJY2786771.1 hypothetical protein [Campylobacter jejuni]BEK43488.1 hypothetical protein B11515_19080 [Campylobacter jejuni]